LLPVLQILDHPISAFSLIAFSNGITALAAICVSMSGIIHRPCIEINPVQDLFLNGVFASVLGTGATGTAFRP
jgi:hypothetical protein